MSEQQGPARLDSWKSIAAYLGRDVRTAIRWEQQRGLPVRRLPGDTRSAVYAFTSEINAWLNRQETEDPSSGQTETAEAIQPSVSKHNSHFKWLLAAGMALLLIGGIGGYRWLLAHAAQPATATFTANTLQAWDNHHHLLWEYRFAEPLASVAAIGDIDLRTHNHISFDMTNRASIHDLYGDGKQEVLAIALFHRGGSTADTDRQVLFCLSSTGKLLWSYEPQTTLEFGNHTYGSQWKLGDMVISDEPGRKTLWLNVIDYVWGKSFIARLDADGHSAIQFVNSGEIDVLERIHTSHGAMLWIGGFNDEYDTASVAIMRDAQPYAASPQTPGTRFVCSNCSSGDPYEYFVLPRYDMGRALHNPNNKVFTLTSGVSKVEVHQAEISEADQVIYEFSNDADPRPLSVNYSSSFWPNHLDLERAGKLDHSLEKCPDRLHPPAVRMYKDGVWQDIVLGKPS